jgi:hypothetical protein
MLFQRQDQFCICIKCYNSIFVEIKFNIIKGNVKYFETWTLSGTAKNTATKDFLLCHTHIS